MKKKDLDSFKQILQDEKKKIIRHLEDLSDTAEQELGGTGGDPIDIASMEINQAALQKIGNRETYLLKKIDYALRKIDEGSYGECESCGEDIGVARLKARPVAQLCIDCKTEQENEERKFSGRERKESDEDVFYEEEDEG
jgi:DnaK suppressor protein